MTEEEAKTKTCCGPIALHPNSHPTCWGSACMAWRWFPPKIRVLADESIETQPHDIGFCGLAGRPE